MKSKIVFFLLVSITLGINIGCGDKFNEKLRDKHLIPYVPVYTQINLGIGGESNLQVPGQPIYLTSSQPDAKSLGYNGQGIVVICLNDTEYACWDATCTNERRFGRRTGCLSGLSHSIFTSLRNPFQSDL